MAGVVVPPRNPAALAEACLRLLRDPDMRRKLGAAARCARLEHFTVDRAISAFDEMYTFRVTGRPDIRTGYRSALPARPESPAEPGRVPDEPGPCLRSRAGLRP